MDIFTRHPKSLVVVYIAVILLVLLLSACQAEQPEPPTVNFDDLSPIKQGYYQQGLVELVPDDLPPPVIPEEPNQADLGTETYYQVCLACHGNWGQGLTDEWRETGFGDDAYCWESKCHASNHPPQGFEFPRIVPPLLGRAALSRLTNAKELYTVINETMPWWFPGSMSVEESLNLTAYIMRARNELPEGVVLTEANLEAFPLHTQPPEVVDETPVGIILIVGLSVAMLSSIWFKKYPDSKENQ